MQLIAVKWVSVSVSAGVCVCAPGSMLNRGQVQTDPPAPSRTLRTMIICVVASVCVCVFAEFIETIVFVPLLCIRLRVDAPVEAAAACKPPPVCTNKQVLLRTSLYFI